MSTNMYTYWYEKSRYNLLKLIKRKYHDTINGADMLDKLTISEHVHML